MILDYWAFQEQRVLETNNLHHELTSIRFFPILKSILFHWAALHKMISYKTFISPVFGHQGNPWWEPQCRSPWCWGTVAGWGHLLDFETMFECWEIFELFRSQNSLWKTFRTLTACWLAGHSHSLIFTCQRWCPYGVVVIDFWHSHNNLLLGKFKFLFFLLKIFVSFRSNVLETMESDALLFIDEKTKLKEPWWDFADT